MSTAARAIGANVIILAIATACSAAPRMAMDETKFDFGYVPQNSAVSHIFWVHSTGDDTLKILKVQPGCGCTQAPLEKNVIPSGDSTRLELIFHSKTGTGHVTKGTTITTNEGPPDERISFAASIVTRPDSTYPVLIDDYKLDMSQFSQKVTSTKKFKLTNVSNKSLSVSLISFDPDFFKIDLPNEIKAGETVDGRLILTQKGIDSGFEKSFTFQVNDEKSSRFTVPVKRTLQIAGSSQTTTNQTH